MWAVGLVVKPEGKPAETDYAAKDRDIAVHVQSNSTGKVLQSFKRSVLKEWDAAHEEAESVDDITRMNAFSEASLLHVLRKRMLENYKIYTWVV